jgi:hypothetical protein
MVKMLRKLSRDVERIRKDLPRVSKKSKKELDARWIYYNTAIEYPEARLKEARAIASKKA